MFPSKGGCGRQEDCQKRAVRRRSCATMRHTQENAAGNCPTQTGLAPAQQVSTSSRERPISKRAGRIRPPSNDGPLRGKAPKRAYNLDWGLLSVLALALAAPAPWAIVDEAAMGGGEGSARATKLDQKPSHSTLCPIWRKSSRPGSNRPAFGRPAAQFWPKSRNFGRVRPNSAERGPDLWSLTGGSQIKRAASEAQPEGVDKL